ALALPGGNQQSLGISRVHAKIYDAGLVIDVEDLFPGLAAIGSLEEPPFLVATVEPAQGPDVDDVRIFGMNADAANLKCSLQPLVSPGLAAVGRLIDAIAVCDGIARIVFAGAHPNNVAVGRCDAHVAD